MLLKSVPLKFAIMNSPIGRLELVSNGEALTGLTIQGSLTPLRNTAHQAALEDAQDEVLTRAVLELNEYFAGEREEFTVPVSPTSNEFQRAVWDEVARVPFGNAMSYGEIAARIGRSLAVRAVGGAVGSNSVPILVPCHRILARDGRLTGYSGGSGLPTKIALLEFEGIAFRH